MKILITNWINLLGVFIVLFLYGIATNVSNPIPTLSQNFWQSILAILFGICINGILFWLLFIVSLIAFDLLFIVKDQNNLKVRLLIEWLLISLPFIYWVIKYNQWIFLMGVIAFLITQLIRQNLIVKAAK